MTPGWLLHDNVRINPATGVAFETHAPVEREGAPLLELVSPRNGYVSFQLAVAAAGEDARELEVLVGELTGALGGTIPAREYSLYAEWFHQAGGEWLPDALVPVGAGGETIRPFRLPSGFGDIPGGRYSALWIDLFVPAAAQPGAYEGSVTIRGQQGEETLRLALLVLHTVLPDTSTVTADLNTYADSLSRRFAHLQDDADRYRNGSYFRLERQFYRMSHEHRCLFHNLPYQHSGAIPLSFAPELAGAGKRMDVRDWSLFDEHFGPYLDGSAFAGTKRGAIPVPFQYLPFNFHWPADYAKFGTKGYRTEFRAVLRRFYDHCTAMGWTRTRFELFLNHKKRYKLFPYDGDETRFVWDEKINDLFCELAGDVLVEKEGARFVFRTDSSWCYGIHYAQYADKIDMWVVNDQIFRWFPEALDHLKAKGRTVFLYYSAEKLQRPLVDTAFMPIMCSARGIDGFTYWQTIGWGDAWYRTPAEDGSLTLFYPGDRLFGIEGPIPSIRLKTLRNAMQLSEGMEVYVRANPHGGREAMRRLAERVFGLDDRYWWDDKPAFVADPPYTWTNALLSEAAAASRHGQLKSGDYAAFREQLWAKLG